MKFIRVYLSPDLGINYSRNLNTDYPDVLFFWRTAPSHPVDLFILSADHILGISKEPGPTPFRLQKCIKNSPEASFFVISPEGTASPSVLRKIPRPPDFVASPLLLKSTFLKYPQDTSLRDRLNNMFLR